MVGCLLVTMPTVYLCVYVCTGVAEQFAIAEAKLRAWSSVDGDESNDDSYDEDFLPANEPTTQSTGTHTHAHTHTAMVKLNHIYFLPTVPLLRHPSPLSPPLCIFHCPTAPVFIPSHFFFFFVPHSQFDIPPASLISFPSLHRHCLCEDGV